MKKLADDVELLWRKVEDKVRVSRCGGNHDVDGFSSTKESNMTMLNCPSLIRDKPTAVKVELIMIAPTTSWVGLGWRPVTATKACQVETALSLLK